MYTQDHQTPKPKRTASVLLRFGRTREDSNGGGGIQDDDPLGGVLVAEPRPAALMSLRISDRGTSPLGSPPHARTRTEPRQKTTVKPKRVAGVVYLSHEGRCHTQPCIYRWTKLVKVVGFV